MYIYALVPLMFQIVCSLKIDHLDKYAFPKASYMIFRNRKKMKIDAAIIDW